MTEGDYNVPQNINELIWYAFGLLGAYFLWSIKRELTGLREDIKEERDARGIIENRIAAIEAVCRERHRD